MEKSLLSRCLSGYSVFLNKFNKFSIIGIFILVLYQILSRHISFLPVYLWTEELSRFLLIWVVFIGASIGVRESDHFDIDLFEGVFSEKPSLRFLQIIIKELAILIFSLFLLIYGWGFAKSGISRTALVLSISLVWIYASFFISGLSMVIFQVYRLIQIVKNHP